VDAGWFLLSIGLIFIAAIAAGISTGKVSTGIAVAVFGFALAIWADEIAGGKDARRAKRK
jgi:hypothetical protein